MPGFQPRYQNATTLLTELVQVFMASLRSLNRKKINPKGINYLTTKLAGNLKAVCTLPARFVKYGRYVEIVEN